MQTPTTTESLATLLREATQHNRTITTTGAGTKLAWGNPITTDEAISTKNLTGVRQHSWQDLTCTVAAGTPWTELQQALAHHHQRVALDPLFPARATVGGILATNDCGLLRMRYGGLRDLVLGMTVVLADGTLARTGGRVVKNVAGYDLPKLLTGSFGTLGIIAEATFRLHPVQPHTAAFTVTSADIVPLAELMHALVTGALSLEAMQLRNTPTSFALDVIFATVPEALAEHEQRLRTLTQLPIEPADATTIFSAREALFANPAATVLKLTTLPTKLSALIAGFAQLNATPGLTAHALADPVGVVTAALTGPPATLITIVEDLRGRLAPIGGSVIVLQRAALPLTTDAWGTPPAALPLMRSIKDQFDPHHLLNPGKFVGGL